MKYYIVDVFTDHLFSGNPAGVCLLEAWPDSKLLQNIAFENNLAETAFLVKREGYYDLCWFTPAIEVDLCGHATIASAFVLFTFYHKDQRELCFKTQSGEMKVFRKDHLLLLDFPARKAIPTKKYTVFNEAFSQECMQVLKAVDFLVVFESEAVVRSIRPRFELLKMIKEEAQLKDDSFGVIITARGNDCDFVSRFFAPNAGIPEDPVTGRAHCTLIPYWAEQLSKTKMFAKQLSQRGGTISCESCGDRVLIGATAVLYLTGEIML